ncbi:MAG: hypothetical protein CVU39_17370 [Chloroflexi bacterium HGW-Chloroflexi-10]|nr:MAG: hypothetical protein CVU39_17370 [Chloroflexi bacterium HGW-Chloroflexi-10]
MKIWDIALKDTLRSLRSMFLLVFMFGIPLLMTGMFAIMFGGQESEESFALPVTRVAAANLDEGSPALQVGMAGIGMAGVDSLGDYFLQNLSSENMDDLVEVREVADEAAALAALENGEADIALVFPQDFSADFSQINSQARIGFYEGANAGMGADVVHTVLTQMSDGLSGMRITLDVAAQSASTDEATMMAISQEYVMATMGQNPHELVTLTALSGEPAAETDIRKSILGPIMGAMMIFFAFFTGTTTAQSILREDEEGTLARLFTTPTRRNKVLVGKFLAVLLTVTVQVIVLLAAAWLIFGIQWGSLVSVVLFATGIILPASAFGIFINAWIKNSKQGGVIYGGLLTVTGMVGMFTVFTGGNTSPAMEMISLFVPQGWAVRGLMQSMQGATLAVVTTTLAVCLLWSLVFIVIGSLRFQKRFA